MSSKPLNKQDSERQQRLAEALRANLARRKAQARARREGQPDDREDGIPAAGQESEKD
ncbi:hypothetical protein GCM10023174_25970 [Chelativorans composti]|jgi:hypothetical protein|uniref:Uncharacterized protein n=1 Tax=Chelativorans composti TaxID=768533 RepID=A0ABW5DJH0_9HYPH